ncbi:MAG: transposase [Chitinophagales bacterium]|nr:transposase [Chitinophagales bacterium]
MLKSEKRIKRQRRFSEDFKLKIVQEYESGQSSVCEMERIYDIGNATIYSWIYKYSNYNKKSIQVVEMKNSQSEKIKLLEARVKD